MLQAAGLLLLWGRGWVETVSAPPEPRHLVAQQLLALALQEHKLGDQLWHREWNGLAPFDRSAEPILQHLINEGYLNDDGGLLFIGPEAEQRFGHRHFIELTASFTAPPQFTVLSGRTEIGRTDPSVLTEQRPGPRRLLLGGRSWQVTFIDWGRKRAFVEPADSGGIAKWTSGGIAGLSYELTRAMREVLLGADPPVSFTRRAESCLRRWRDDEATNIVHPAGSVSGDPSGGRRAVVDLGRLSRERDTGCDAGDSRRSGSAADGLLGAAARRPHSRNVACGPRSLR
jgi:ATP-dependent Lhr-like helicase